MKLIKTFFLRTISTFIGCMLVVLLISINIIMILFYPVILGIIIVKSLLFKEYSSLAVSKDKTDEFIDNNVNIPLVNLIQQITDYNEKLCEKDY